MPQISENIEPSISLIFSECQFKITEPENLIAPPSTYQHDTKVFTTNSCLDINNIKSSYATQLSDPDLQIFNNTTFHP